MANNSDSITQTYYEGWFKDLGQPGKEFQLPNISSPLCSLDCMTCKDVFNLVKQGSYPITTLDDLLTSEAIPIPPMETKVPVAASGPFDMQAIRKAASNSLVKHDFNISSNSSKVQGLHFGTAISMEPSGMYPLKDKHPYAVAHSKQQVDMFGSELSYVNPFSNNFSPIQVRPYFVNIDNQSSEVGSSTVGQTLLSNLDYSGACFDYCDSCFLTHYPFQGNMIGHATFNTRKQ